MFATRVNRYARYVVFAAVAGSLLAGCKGHGSSSTTIPQSLTNWTWKAGTNAANGLGYYVSEGTATTTGLPSGRYGAMSWKDSSGQFWVFSGVGGVSDMWRFNTTTLQWAWMAGNASTATNTTAVYGTIGVAASTNLPGQRDSGATWTDASGNLWMFGGYGTDSNGLIGYLNDVWMFNPVSNLWTWEGAAGSDQAGSLSAPVVWGTQGTASTSNQPAPRSNSAFWKDASGNFWMFGGEGYLNNTTGVQNDLWEFNPTTLAWTWVGGSQLQAVKGVYGTIGVASAANLPGARQSATTWVDSTGTFWMYGGTGVDAAGTVGQLGDLWKFSTATHQWTWVSGSSTVNNLGVYGTNAVAATTNLPGARSGAAGWIDSSNNLWLFGGYGINGIPTGVNLSTTTGTLVILNDLWEYQASTKQWVWYNGSYNGSAAGYYGTLGLLSAGNMPGSRYAASVWNDSSGNFWLFGGEGYDAAGTNGRLGDVWNFVP